MSGTLDIYLDYNALTQLVADTLPLTDRPHVIRLYNNQIQSIDVGAFVMPSTTGK